MTSFKKLYNEEIKQNLVKEFKYDSVMNAPKLEKIVLNIGSGEGSKDDKFITAILNDLELITGQKPVVTRAKKSIAGFQIRDGMSVGAKVTLRNENMYVFLEKLVKVALPRVRDFRGINPRSFDGFGNYTLGIKEQLIFPEIEFDNVVKIKGMDIVFVTTAETDEEALALLKGFGLPFRK